MNRRFEAAVREVRDGARRLVRDWRFTAAAVVSWALGIGANTAMFSLINATLFRGQSIVDPDRLVDIYQNGRRTRGHGRQLVPGLSGHGRVHRRLREHDGRVRPTRRELPGRWRAAAGGRRAHDGDVPVRPRAPAIARALVRCGGRHAWRRRRGRRSGTRPGRGNSAPIRP